MSKLAIFFATSDYDKVTGLSSYTMSLLRACVKQSELAGTQVFFLTTMRNSETLPVSPNLVVRRFSPPFPWKIAYVVFNIWAYSFLVFKRVNNVISTTPYGIFGPGLNQVSVVHDLYIFRPNRYSPLERLYFRVFFRAVALASRLIVCISEQTRRALLEAYPALAAKAVVVRSASKFKATSPTALHHERRFGLFVANIEENKNVECLLQAAKLLEDSRRPFNIRWVGRDRSAAIERWSQQTAMPSNFEPLGGVSDCDLADLYEKALFLVVPSTEEGFCLPVLEAQGYGTPVIASDIEILHEVAGAGALFFDPSSPSELAALMESIISDAARWRCLSEAALQNAAQFSWTKTASQFMRLLDGPKEESQEHEQVGL